ncbi:dTDP-glucose 4,6-dehydratase [Lacimicrobium alkaliphilum]|nr:dTDP-glucose 4,6-dehydratase [Lacimicrobium alkaliphilum]
MMDIPGIKRILITGGCGFIGSALVRHLMHSTACHVLNIDKLTYAANPEAVKDAADSARYQHAVADICDRSKIKTLISRFQPDAILHLAAESHVDRSISSPAVFMQTNIIGTYSLLEEALAYWQELSESRQSRFKFIHISTDEVFGDLETDDSAFDESSPYLPSSPYSASKASSDHLARAWHRTYRLPVIVTNCSNNYGPYQHHEKLIPHMTMCALKEQPLPIYGNGKNIRDWLFVDDYVDALTSVLRDGVAGETYCIGGNNELTNLELVNTLCAELDILRPRVKGRYIDLLEFVEDRAGHDKRYAINSQKITSQLGWRPSHNFREGLNKTLCWLLEQYSEPFNRANSHFCTSGEGSEVK